MAAIIQIRQKEKFMGTMKHGVDLLEEITKICQERSIHLGSIEAIGAVQKASIAFYNQTKRDYVPMTINEPLEMTSLTGNISIKDGNPFVHAHVTLADSKGNVYGGHLAPGTIVFACEFIIKTFDGLMLERRFDEDTGLSLWSLQE